jgi:hypothetical protein
MRSRKLKLAKKLDVSPDIAGPVAASAILNHTEPCRRIVSGAMLCWMVVHPSEVY